jgi:hypothetical protein
MQILSEIRLLEKEIKRIKLMHSLGKISLSDSKKEIRVLDSRLKVLVKALPEKERTALLFRKEYRSVDY